MGVTAIAVIEMVVIGAMKSEYTEPHRLSFLEKTEQTTEELSSFHLCPRVMGPWMPCYGSRMSRLSGAKFHSLHVEQGKGQEDLSRYLQQVFGKVLAIIQLVQIGNELLAGHLLANVLSWRNGSA